MLLLHVLLTKLLFDVLCATEVLPQESTRHAHAPLLWRLDECSRGMMPWEGANLSTPACARGQRGRGRAPHTTRRVTHTALPF